MSKKIKKKLHYFTLGPELNILFEDYIECNYINKTKLLENLIIKYLEEQKIIKSK